MGKEQKRDWVQLLAKAGCIWGLILFGGIGLIILLLLVGGC